MTRIAVALQTCGREDYTARTVESFVRMNPDRSRFVLLHGDDASASRWNLKIARRHGFRTVVQHTERLGCLALRTALIEQAAKHAKWIVVLENDCEAVRPFPWALFDHFRQDPSIWCLRLFGQFKDRSRQDLAKTRHQWTGEPVFWTWRQDAPEPCEVAQVHWSAQPCVTRHKPLVALHEHGVRELQRLTARVVDNVFVHFGIVRTAPMPAAEVAC